VYFNVILSHHQLKAESYHNQPVKITKLAKIANLLQITANGIVPSELCIQNVFKKLFWIKIRQPVAVNILTHFRYARQLLVIRTHTLLQWSQLIKLLLFHQITRVSLVWILRLLINNMKLTLCDFKMKDKR